MSADVGPGAAAFVPADADLAGLAEAAKECKGCHLWEGTTQTVFGRGNAAAEVVLVGEQPGDVEDQMGAPFVGPAGHLLVRALDEAGVDRSALWVTNAVKHFKFERRGTRRIHQTPDAREVAACRPWLSAELNRLRPKLVVLLGATAGKALLGPSFRVTRDRGALIDGPAGSGSQMLATIHPSAVLRADDQDAAYAGLVADLRIVAPFAPRADVGEVRSPVGG